MVRGIAVVAQPEGQRLDAVDHERAEHGGRQVCAVRHRGDVACRLLRTVAWRAVPVLEGARGVGVGGVRGSVRGRRHRTRAPPCGRQPQPERGRGRRVGAERTGRQLADVGLRPAARQPDRQRPAGEGVAAGRGGRQRRRGQDADGEALRGIRADLHRAGSVDFDVHRAVGAGGDRQGAQDDEGGFERRVGADRAGRQNAGASFRAVGARQLRRARQRPAGEAVAAGRGGRQRRRGQDAEGEASRGTGADRHCAGAADFGGHRAVGASGDRQGGRDGLEGGFDRRVGPDRAGRQRARVACRAAGARQPLRRQRPAGELVAGGRGGRQRHRVPGDGDRAGSAGVDDPGIAKANSDAHRAASGVAGHDRQGGLGRCRRRPRLRWRRAAPAPAGHQRAGEQRGACHAGPHGVRPVGAARSPAWRTAPFVPVQAAHGIFFAHGIFSCRGISCRGIFPFSHGIFSLFSWSLATDASGSSRLRPAGPRRHSGASPRRCHCTPATALAAKREPLIPGSGARGADASRGRLSPAREGHEPDGQAGPRPGTGATGGSVQVGCAGMLHGVPGVGGVAADRL